MNTIKKFGIAGLAALVLGFSSSKPVDAATIHVSSGQSIQAAVNASASGDSILVGPGTYNEDVIITDKSLLIKSESGAQATKIIGVANFRPAVSFENSDASAVVQTLDGFTVEKSNASGVAFDGPNAQASIQNCILQNCRDYGLIVNYTNSNIVDNLIQYNGGGIYGYMNYSAKIKRNVISNLKDLNAGIYFGLRPGAESPTDEVSNNTIVKNKMGGLGISPKYHHNIIAFNGKYGIFCAGNGQNQGCNVVYGNYFDDPNAVSEHYPPGSNMNYTNCNTINNLTSIPPTNPTDIQKDPKFCNASINDYTLSASSPAVTSQSCGVIGAKGMDLRCSATPAKPTSWGKIRNMYR